VNIDRFIGPRCVYPDVADLHGRVCAGTPAGKSKHVWL